VSEGTEPPAGPPEGWQGRLSPAAAGEHGEAAERAVEDAVVARLVEGRPCPSWECFDDAVRRLLLVTGGGLGEEEAQAAVEAARDRMLADGRLLGGRRTGDFWRLA